MTKAMIARRQSFILLAHKPKLIQKKKKWGFAPMVFKFFKNMLETEDVTKIPRQNQIAYCNYKYPKPLFHWALWKIKAFSSTVPHLL